MKKLLTFLLILTLAAAAGLAVSAAAAEEADTSPVFTGEYDGGEYVVRIPLSGTDAWTFGFTDGEQTAVEVAAAEQTDGCLVIRLAPAADGEATLVLGHMADGVCDGLHTVDVRVENGSIEATGGSFTAAPSVYELLFVLAGEWLEEDTQFTSLQIEWSVDGGLALTFVSPMTHGEYVLRATARYDCVMDALVYGNGARFDLTAEGTASETPAEEGLAGFVTFAGTDEAPQLVWHDGETEIVFERAPALPEYAYTGSDPVEAALVNHMAEENWGANYLTYPGCAAIPAPIVIGTEAVDETHMKVWANLWTNTYQKMGSVLKSVAGGECPCVAILEKDGEGWKVTELTEAGDGDDYWADITAFTGGDETLLDGFRASGIDEEPGLSVRIRFIRDYVQANGLAITSFQDYGWPEVPLGE